MNNFQTEQETFWNGEFGNEYINRNGGASAIHRFSNVLSHTQGITS